MKRDGSSVRRDEAGDNGEAEIESASRAIAFLVFLRKGFQDVTQHGRVCTVLLTT
jgi:hypothetical protein